MIAPTDFPRAFLPRGFTIGHWTDRDGQTGCTVILAAGGAAGGVDVRGAASSTLCTDTLRPATLVEHAHGVLLTGGSAFGLEAAAGVMRYLEEHGSGYELAGVRVPIVAGAVIFDLGTGDPRARPDRDAGYAACAAATTDPGRGALGAVGAGTGATVAKGGGPSQIRPGGLGIASGRVGEAIVSAVMVVNSVGGVWDDDRHEWVVPLTAADVRGRGGAGGAVAPRGVQPGTNTTIGAVITDATLGKDQANRLATAAHDGIGRAIRPSRTMYDGDTIFGLATGKVAGSYNAVEAVAAELVARAIAAGVRAAQP